MDVSYDLENFGSTIIGYSPLTLTINPTLYFENFFPNDIVGKIIYNWGDGETTKIIYEKDVSNPKTQSVTHSYYLNSSNSEYFTLEIQYWLLNSFNDLTGTIYVQLVAPKLIKTSDDDISGSFDEFHLIKIKNWNDKTFLVFESKNPNKLFFQEHQN